LRVAVVRQRYSAYGGAQAQPANVVLRAELA